jgi:hypothetical protein
VPYDTLQIGETFLAFLACILEDLQLSHSLIINIIKALFDEHLITYDRQQTNNTTATNTLTIPNFYQ